MRILLDVGHGLGNGKDGSFDPGAVGFGVTEYGLMRELADKLPPVLSNGTEIYRLPDVRLAQVVSVANQEKRDGDVLISLHMNAAISKAATGVEVVISQLAPPSRKIQAKTMAGVLSEVLGLRNRGVLLDGQTVKGGRNGLAIVRDTLCPAFLLELGFISNEGDIAAVRERGADAVEKAILAFQESA